METLDEVWAGDLFERRKEADDLVGYLESVAGRPPVREDGHAHVMAIDTAYGQGKTFFLRRLDRHLRSTEHVSAYVDAWLDDLEDQPLVALAATLDTALAGWTAKSDTVADGVARFKEKAGRVARIVGLGLAKRGAGFLITQGAAEALGDELAKMSENTRDIATDALKESGMAVVDDAAGAFAPLTTPSMDARIASFREGKEAVQAMRDSLAFVVQALNRVGMKLPITIIVDELDRCRPTYAIKVLEEIKHLFDVSGVAFLLGLHGRQLEHSVTAAYGQGFDGGAYLRRFFNRRYTLRSAELLPLVEHLIERLSINISLLDHPSVRKSEEYNAVELPRPVLITAYLKMYELSARDTFSIMEALQTAVALTKGKQVQLSYLMPLIISHYLGRAGLVAPPSPAPWHLVFATGPFDQELKEWGVPTYVQQIHAAAQQDDRELTRAVNAHDLPSRIVVDYGFRNGSNDYHLLQNYERLIGAVDRFS